VLVPFHFQPVPLRLLACLDAHSVTTLHYASAEPLVSRDTTPGGTKPHLGWSAHGMNTNF